MKIKHNFKTVFIYAGIAAFCALFAGIYQMNSHGVHSVYMTWMFVAPLVLGALVFLVLGLMKKEWSNPGRTVYHSGIAALTVGCLVQGGLEIYGTTSKLVPIYFVAAGILLTAGIVVGVIWAACEKKSSL